MSAENNGVTINKARGFATISPERRREISRKGGVAAHMKGTAHEFTSEEARINGRLGGKACHARRAARMIAAINAGTEPSNNV